MIEIKSIGFMGNSANERGVCLLVRDSESMLTESGNVLSSSTTLALRFNPMEAQLLIEELKRALNTQYPDAEYVIQLDQFRKWFAREEGEAK